MEKYRIEIKWAAIFLVMTLAWMLMEKLSGLHDVYIEKHMIVTNLFMIPAVTIFFLALREKRSRYYNGMMTFRQGFYCGAIITVIVTIFTPLTQYLTSEVISKEYFENAKRYSIVSGAMKVEDAEKYFNLENYMLMATLGALVMGLVTSAVVAFFTRTKEIPAAR